MGHQLGNAALAVFGVYIVFGAFLANGGKYDIYSRSKERPVSLIGRVVMFICGSGIVALSIISLISK
jgi:hypothetical protein